MAFKIPGMGEMVEFTTLDGDRCPAMVVRANLLTGVATLHAFTADGRRLFTVGVPHSADQRPGTWRRLEA